MADAGALASGPALPPRRRFASPFLRRILLVNALPLALLVIGLLYLDQYQNGLMDADVSALREQARIYAGALGESAVQAGSGDHPVLTQDLARPLLYRLTDPTPFAQARLFGPDGNIVADSQVREGAGGAIVTEPLPPPANGGALSSLVSWFYDHLLAWAPSAGGIPVRQLDKSDGADWQPDLKAVLALRGNDTGQEVPPYIRRTTDGRLLVTVAEPVTHDNQTVGMILLTHDARRVDQAVLSVRISILGLFFVALVLTVLLSWYLAQTIARPILRLAIAAQEMREGHGRTGAVPASLLERGDEISTLARALSDSATALWGRMDAIERFAADVSHEIKNPLTSIRSAIETLRRVEDANQSRNNLLAIMADDVLRLDRLITDISDASRVDAEISRAAPERQDIVAMLGALADIDDATRLPGAPIVTAAEMKAGLGVAAVEGRLVQVLGNLIGNARSFSPPSGRIELSAVETAEGMVDITVSDEGPGIPEGKLEDVFERFYSERPQGESFGKHSGLGLSISKQIIEALNGRIRAENRHDEAGRVLGARFIITLPKA
ncbi:stimulus-sensing domain-containing protein [Acidisoma cellulosilytica]|uniref:histidine kinase n=1 Tax=Acidisoma cellulosilyticum TaxID=2802395 RepID=A0A963YZN7_9PROT|nr:stimulus-sensing domain-containing protein [Acidisoma cellulosilyticum]MCB8879140.1 stimulus-sensing domain-containing protein [Acidisoma cellulosilyticum]